MIHDPNCKHCKRKARDAELAYADACFREALMSGDPFADAVLYGQLMVTSANLGS